MSIGSKIESLIEMQVDLLHAAYQAKADIVGLAIRNIDSFKDLEPLVELIEGTEDPKYIFSVAAVAELFDTIKDAILADGDVSESELEVAKALIDSCIHRYSWLKEYQRFDPLIDTDEVKDLLIAWENDGSLLGGDFKNGAIVYPSLKLAAIVAGVSGSPALFDTAAKITSLIAKLIVSVGGIDDKEQQFLDTSTKRLEVWRKVSLNISSTTREAEKVISGNANDATETKTVVVEATLTPERALSEAMTELNDLVGVPEVKAEITKIINFLKIRKQRLAANLPLPKQSLHFVFTGNPGTGKTTVARILSRILYGFEVLKSDVLIEADRAALVGGYLGQTAIKTAEVIDKATNGVLFIDEAYTLSPKSAHGDMFGQEAIDTILKKMEDMRDRLVVMVAGYPDQMRTFLLANPGLESRFTRFIEFADYHVSDMCEIFFRLGIANSYRLTQDALGNLAIFFNRAYAKRDQNFGNARFVRNAYEKTLGRHADRLAEYSGDLNRDMLVTIEADDLPFAMVLGIPKPLDLSESKWRGKCPSCGKIAESGLNVIGKRVRCKCGATFRFPWWNLVPESLPALTGFKAFERDEDLVGKTDEKDKVDGFREKKA